MEVVTSFTPRGYKWFLSVRNSFNNEELFLSVYEAGNWKAKCPHLKIKIPHSCLKLSPSPFSIYCSLWWSLLWSLLPRTLTGGKSIYFFSWQGRILCIVESDISSCQVNVLYKTASRAWILSHTPWHLSEGSKMKQSCMSLDAFALWSCQFVVCCVSNFSFALTFWLCFWFCWGSDPQMSSTLCIAVALLSLSLSPSFLLTIINPGSWGLHR